MYDLAEIQGLAADETAINPALHASSAVLIYAAYDHLSKLYNWRGSGSELTDAERDDIEALIGTLYADMLTTVEIPIVNELPVGSMFVSANTTSNPTLNSWTLYCDGATYLKVDYPELWDVLGTPFRIDANSFRVPDLRNRFVYGSTTMPTPIGLTGGAATHQLTTAEIPSHTHVQKTLTSTSGAISGTVNSVDSTAGNITDDQPTGATGGGGSHNNMPPYIILKWYIVAKPS